MKNLIKNHCILFSIILLIISIIGAFAFNDIIGHFCVAALLIALMTYLKFEDTYFFKLQGTLKTVLCGLPLILIILLGNVITIIQTENFKWDKVPTPYEFILFLISMLGVGIFEESLMRGTLFNIMKESWKDKKHCLLKAAIISSILFGFPHILNYFSNPALKMQTASQIIYASFMGIYFCGLYIKHKNFIGLCLIHTLVDFLGEGCALFSSSFASTMIHDIPPCEAILQTLICLPLAYLGIVYIHQTVDKNLNF